MLQELIAGKLKNTGKAIFNPSGDSNARKDNLLQRIASSRAAYPDDAGESAASKPLLCGRIGDAIIFVGSLLSSVGRFASMECCVRLESLVSRLVNGLDMGMIDPKGQGVSRRTAIYLRIWTGVVMALMAIFVILVPYQIGLGTYPDSQHIVYNIFDGLMLIDAYLVAHTGIEINGEICLDRKIVWSQIKWRRTQLFLCLPYDLITHFMEEGLFWRPNFQLPRFFMVPMRIMRAFDIFGVRELTAKVRMMLLLMTVLWFIHVCACFWAWCGVSARAKQWAGGDDVSTWATVNNVEDSRILVYNTALYFVLTVLSTCGFGDIFPVNLVEAVVCCCILFLGLVLFSGLKAMFAVLLQVSNKRLRNNFGCLFSAAAARSAKVGSGLTTFYVLLQELMQQTSDLQNKQDSVITFATEFGIPRRAVNRVNNHVQLQVVSYLAFLLLQQHTLKR